MMKILFLVFTIYNYNHFRGVSGKKEALPRFIMEFTVMPPIFGSYSYDPIKQVFDIEKPTINETNTHNSQFTPDPVVIQYEKIVNQTNLSTSQAFRFIKNQNILSRSRIFRPRVSVTIPEKAIPLAEVARSKLLNWWTVPKSVTIRNATKAN